MFVEYHIVVVFSNVQMFSFVLRNDIATVVEILVKDLKIFSTFNEGLYKELANLITLENIR